jgi:hypothetical protein
MGFKELVAPGSIEASFTSVTAYEARGITVAEGVCEAVQARAAGAEYRVAISASVNLACQALVGDDFAESEEAWRKEVKSKGPFALIAVGPTEFFPCAAGRSMRAPDGSLVTYDCFPQAREALRSLEKRVLPPVVAALTFALNQPDRFFLLKKLGRGSAGRTPELTTVQDIRMEFRAEGYVSRPTEPTELTERLQAVSQRASRLNQKAAGFFALGVGEDDQLKKFLYFFLSLEIETHAVFGRINHRNKVESAVAPSAGVRPALAGLLERQLSSLGNLLDRFVWCASCSWTNLTETDVATFRSLKEARDAIAHGRASEPPPGFARTAELLAHKILWHA